MQTGMVRWRSTSQRGTPGKRLRMQCFTYLEGKAKWNYEACDEKGDLTPDKILEGMDMIYSTSVSFRNLNAKLCLKQGP